MLEADENIFFPWKFWIYFCSLRFVFTKTRILYVEGAFDIRVKEDKALKGFLIFNIRWQIEIAKVTYQKDQFLEKFLHGKFWKLKQNLIQNRRY